MNLPDLSDEELIRWCSAQEPTGDGTSMFDPPLSERELWDCAILVEKLHGKRALQHIGERMHALAEAGDADGVAAWKAIAHRYGRLREAQRTLTDLARLHAKRPPADQREPAASMHGMPLWSEPGLAGDG